MQHVRLDHDPQRQLLQVRELWDHLGVRVMRPMDIKQGSISPFSGAPTEYDSVYALVKRAILEHLVICAWYDGHYREMCPHVLGTKNGREQALFYQFGGTSKSGLQPAGSPNNWRCVALEKLSRIELRTGDWRTGPNHSRPQTCVDIIDVEVQF